MSKVKLENGSFNHIPMIDFSSNVMGNLLKVKEVLTKVGEEKGFVLASGRSYHYYGANLLTQEEWVIFMAKCLLINSRDETVINSRYIGHSLFDGYCGLRLTSSSGKPQVPYVVDVL